MDKGIATFPTSIAVSTCHYESWRYWTHIAIMASMYHKNGTHFFVLCRHGEYLVTLNKLNIYTKETPSWQPTNPLPLSLPTVISCNEVIEARRGEGGKWTGLNGTVVSPNFPQQYPARLQCRVDFKAPPSYRVRILFTDFLLHHPLNVSNRNCDVVDSLSLFEGTQKGSRLAVFCGPGVPRPVMSSGSYLSLKFRSYTSGPDVKGYKAHFLFVNDFGLETGRQLVPNRCVFEFNSTETSSGEFYTPNPGGKYPRNTECQYVFVALPHQKVRLSFKFFDVEGIAPCSDRSDSDYCFKTSAGLPLNYFPTPSCLPPFPHFLLHPLPLLFPFLLLPSPSFPLQVIDSPGPYFCVTFRSNHKFDGLGFAASYTFKQNDGNSTCELSPRVAMAGVFRLHSRGTETSRVISTFVVVSD
ncbi:suppressor of lurcher protein 1-like [Penaeus monodon]|uniref:suppressor of lurcher protein 1-like n=1 Tax=Penaeus monodon TaxID=6687 RepID=UPI0018A7C61B|nr:suppressor of lurcher protein 1-like [Penaeus monodon]